MFFLSLSFGIFVCNTNKIFLFSRFSKVKRVLVKAVLHGRFVWYDLYDSYSVLVWFDKSERVNCKIITTFCIKICVIRYLKDRMSSISSNFYEGILKLNKSHTNRIIQIVSCKTALSIFFCSHSFVFCFLFSKAIFKWRY